MTDQHSLTSGKNASLVGTTIDEKYQILGILGSGGFGNVYQARQTQLDRVVALKMLSDTLPDDDAIRLRFEREAQAINSLKHRNIVLFYGYGTWNKAPYMVMELVRGQCLDRLLASGNPLEPESCLAIARQACDALACAHTNGVIHRDLKPSNIILLDNESDLTIKIIDFGLAKLLPGFSQRQQKLTEAGVAVGSVLYMSPEQCSGKVVDERSDIYSLGCILQHCLTGAPPFFADNSVAVMYQHLHQLPNSLETFIPETTATKIFQDVLDRSLAKDPANRYSSVAEMMADLDRIPKGMLATDAHSVSGPRPISAPRNKPVSSQQSTTSKKHGDTQTFGPLPLKWMVAGLIPIVVLMLYVSTHREMKLFTKTSSSILYHDLLQDEPLSLDTEKARLAMIERAKAIVEANKRDGLLAPSENVGVWHRLANLYLTTRQPKAAINAALIALELQNHIAPNVETYSLLHVAGRAADEGIQRKKYAALLEKPSEYKQTDSEEIRKAKTFMRLDLASMHLNMDHVERASKILDTTPPIDNVVITARSLTVRGELALARHQPLKAIQQFSESLKLTDDSAVSGPRQILTLSLAYALAEKRPQAEEHLRFFQAQQKSIGLESQGIVMIAAAAQHKWERAATLLDAQVAVAEADLINYFKWHRDLEFAEFARLADNDGQSALAAKARKKNMQLMERARNAQ